MINKTDPLDLYVENIRQSGLTIYGHIDKDDLKLWIPTSILEELLSCGLKGVSLHGLPLRSRSKHVKRLICQILGYPIPATFKKTQPRFSGQLFDIYIQKSNNLQIWNEEVSLSRRYVIIKVNNDNIIDGVKVVTGDVIACLDRTGTLTQKYQASLIKGRETAELVVLEDTDILRPLLKTQDFPKAFRNNPVDNPSSKYLLPIKVIFERLIKLQGIKFPDVGYDQERNRGAQLHKQVCQVLGYERYRDIGQFPDIPHQLLEIKLQSSPTIDLGLVKPDSKEILGNIRINGKQIRHCDVRYAIFYAEIKDMKVILTRVYVTTGEAFFLRFPQFKGMETNKKLQIPLPKNFFND